MREYFRLTDFEPTTQSEAALFAAHYLTGQHQGQFLKQFPNGNALKQLWKSLGATELERLIWAEARIACNYTHLPYAERLECEQRDRLEWDAMLQRQFEAEVEEMFDGVH
jgi:hypothetical protein